MVHLAEERRRLVRDDREPDSARLAALLAQAPMLTAEQERWSEALAVQRRYGDGAHIHVVGRITALATAGDIDGVRRWRATAARLDQLAGGRIQ